VIRSGGGFDDEVIGRFYANAQGDLTTGGNSIEFMSVDTGGEDDFADIRGNVIDEFFGVVGGGNDDVDFINNQINSNGLLDGGSGFDRLTFLGNLILGSFQTIGFEQQNGVFDPDAP
jgi:hypothetical protein